MKVTFAPLAGEKSQGIEALKDAASGAAYSDAVRVDLPSHSLLFISGKTGTKAGRLVGRTLREQAKQVLENIQASLAAHGGTMSNVTRLRIYVTAIDAASIRDVHEVRTEFFDKDAYPASTLVRVDQLVRDGALIEMEADVVLPPR